MPGLRPVARSASVPKIGPDFARFVASRQETELAYWAATQEEAHPSRILLDHSRPGARLGELYDEMLTSNATLAGLWEKRWKAVVGLPWALVPGDTSRRARKIARLAEIALDQIQGLDKNLRHQLEGIPKGVSFDEIRWERRTRGPLAGLWVPVEIEDRPMHRFAFKAGGALHVRRRDGTLAPAQPGRFLVLRHGTKDQPWGSPLLDRVWWFYWLAIHAWKYYGVALEKWAQPVVLVRYERARGASDEEAETLNEQAVANALDVGASVQTEMAAAVPKDVEVEFKEAMRGGSVSYEQFIGLIDRAMALVILGEVDTSGLAKGPGSHAKSRVSNDVRLETIRMDARELADTLTDQLLAVFARVNFGSEAPVPYWEFDVEDAENRAARQAGAQNILNRGLPLEREYFYRINYGRVPEAGADVVQDDLVIGTSGFAEPPGADAGDDPPPPAETEDDGQLADAVRWRRGRRVVRRQRHVERFGNWADQELVA